MGKPKTGYAFIHPIFPTDFGRPGTIGGFAGMNEAGIVIAAQGCPSMNMSLYGTPTTMVLRYILQHAGSVDETITQSTMIDFHPTKNGWRILRPTRPATGTAAPQPFTIDQPTFCGAGVSPAGGIGELPTA